MSTREYNGHHRVAILKAIDEALEVSASDSNGLLSAKQQIDWALEEKSILAVALREIYAIRGEDSDIERITNEALEKANA